MQSTLVDQDWIQFAQAAMKLKDYTEAIKCWQRAYEIFPNNLNVLLGISKTYMEVGEVATADTFCLKAMKIGENIDALLLHAEISMRKKNYSGAAECWEILETKFPDNSEYYFRAAKICEKYEDFLQADTFYALASQCDSTYDWIYIKSALSISNIDNKNALKEAIRRIISKKYTPKSNNELLFMASLFTSLFNSEDDPIFRLIYNKFLTNFIFTDTTKKQSLPLQNFLKERIALFLHSVISVNFILPVLKKIPYPLIDILFDTKSETDDEYIKIYGLDKYNIYYGRENIKHYKTIIIDYVHLFNMKNFDFCNAKIIAFAHFTDNSIDGLLSHLVILSSKNQYIKSNKITLKNMNKRNFSYINKYQYQDKCEFTYTGPYHIGDFLKNNQDKKILRQQLSQKLERLIPDSKPLVACLEDELSYSGQIITGLNRLSKYCTIIYKPIYKHKSSFFNRLNKDIIILEDSALAPNLLRFSADFLLCGFCSGSFTTSIMLGTPCIPFYTRIVCNKNEGINGIPRNWKELIPNKLEVLNQQCKKILLYNWTHYFDILDTHSIKEAIFGQKYISWYKKHLPDLQKKAFGDYLIEDAPLKTAEYIIRFASEGTLGRDCSDIYLKETFFRTLSHTSL